jgi:hypothetical protein
MGRLLRAIVVGLLAGFAGAGASCVVSQAGATREHTIFGGAAASGVAVALFAWARRDQQTELPDDENHGQPQTQERGGTGDGGSTTSVPARGKQEVLEDEDVGAIGIPTMKTTRDRSISADECVKEAKASVPRADR